MSVQLETPLDYSQYQNIISRMPIGLWVVVCNEHADGSTEQSFEQFPIRVVEINPAAARLLGISTEPLSAMATQAVLQNFIHIDIAQHCQEVMRTGEDQQVENVRYQMGDQILHLALDILYAENHACVVLFQNKTAQKLASERLLHGQRVAHIGDWDWGLSSDTIHFSDELTRIFGISSAQLPLTFERAMSLIHPDDWDTVKNAIQRSIRTLDPFSIYFRLLRTDKTERVVHCIGHVEADADEQPMRLWGTTQDVTERWLTQEKVRTSESRLRAITDSASDAMISFTDQGEITFWNPGAARIFGVESEKVLGTSVENFIVTPLSWPLTNVNDKQKKSLDEAQINGAANPEAWDIHGQQEVTATTFDGTTFPAEMSLGSWSHNGSTFHTVILRDITRRRRAETELQEFAHQLEASNRELQDFAYIASHDLQEPLRKINAFSDRLRSKYSATLDDTALDYLSRMQNAAQRMQVLINDLLTLSRVTTKGKPFDPTDLNAVLYAVLDDLEATIQQSDGEVVVEELPELEADPLQMRQLFQNLISNALKFRRDDVTPIVRVYSDTQNCASQTNIASRADEQECAPPKQSLNPEKMHRILFSDNGIGFDEKYLDRIFQPFQRLHGRNAYTGTGMGLAICRKIIERHNGTITAQSTPDVGTTFIVTLPEKQTGNSLNES